MAEETMGGGEDGGRDELEKEAREVYGWMPKEEFKGRAEDWVDAPEYLEKARGVLPIVQANNRRLTREMAAIRDQNQRTEAALRAATAAINALEESHAETTEAQREETRAGLKAELAAASREGDHEKVADLTDQLTRLNTAEKRKPADDDDADLGTRRGPAIPAAMKAEIEGWYADNPDYKTGRKAALSYAVSQEFRANGDLRQGAEFLDAVADEVEKSLGSKARAGHSRVASDTGGRGRSSPANGGKSYADLPAEAKQACDRLAAKVVGPGKAHKDLASWRSSYVKQYYE